MRALGFVVVAVAACGGDDPKPSGTVDAPKPGGDPCADPAAKGNDKGVGRYCTAGGGECNQNSNLGSFIFCTKDYEPDEAVSYCTGPCSKDADCGQGAFCSGSGSGGRGCEPAACGGAPVDASVP